MRVVVQRVLKASCLVDGTVVSTISQGLLLLVGLKHSDTTQEVTKMAQKISKMRIFEDQSGKMNLSLMDIKGEILSISQFTLYANPYNGNRPSFTEAMNPSFAKTLYEKFNDELRALGIKVENGIFGADMKLDIVCDGPVTINLEY